MKKSLFWIGGCLLFMAFVKYALLSHAGTCSDLEKESKLVIAKSQSCSVNEDCTAILLFCPFECLTPVRRSALDEVRNAVGSYQKSCLMVCPECPKGLSTRVRCQAGKCSSSRQ